MKVKNALNFENESNDQFAREALVVLVFNTIICTLVAVFVWLAFPSIGKHGLLSNWVYSQCVGQSICVSYLVFNYFLELKRIRSIVAYVVGTPVIVFAGFIIGKYLAAFLLSDPAMSSIYGPTFWTSLLVTLFVSLFSIVFYTTWAHVTALKMAAARESARASDAKLSMLQAQVEPHMLFNTLSNLRSLIDSNPNTAQVMLDHLVDYLRATLAGSMHNTSSLKQEFNLLENYLSLMAIRMGDRLSFELQLPEELAEVSVPVLILQPIVENAIKHGLEQTIDGGRITVKAQLYEHIVAVEVIDTGVGYNATDHALSDGFGMHSVRDRLQSADALYDVLTISSPLAGHKNGTSITVRFPLLPTSLSKVEQS